MRFLSLLFAFSLLSSALALPLSMEHVQDQGVESSWLSSDWQIEVISQFGGSSSMDIAIDSLNRPSVLYCPPGEVWLSSRNESGWNGELITETVGGGLCGSMDLGPDDTPHIFFAIPPPGAPPWPHYAAKENDSWILRPVTVCRGGDISVDTEGEPHIACFSKMEGSTMWEIRHVTSLNDSWHMEYIDSIPRAPSSGWISLVVDPSNNPHLLYYTDATGEVRYAYRENGTWDIEVVDVIGDIQAIGTQGSLALDDAGKPLASYIIRTEPKRLDIFYAQKDVNGWTEEFVRRGYYPSMDVSSTGLPRISLVAGYPDHHLLLATPTPKEWVFEVVYESRVYAHQFPDFVLDACDNPHLAFFSNDDAGAMYATKGEPCPPEPEEASMSLDIDPDTLNLKSRGRWITAYLSSENASVYDIDIFSIRLQDTLEAERYDYQDDVLMLKFNRQDFKDTVQGGESVQVEITGKWKDGTAFEACDHIKVIEPGMG